MTTLSKHTTKIFLSAVIVCIIMSGLFVYSYNSLRVKETEYRETLQVIADYSKQTKEAQQAKELLDNTQEKRKQLDDYFLTVIEIAQFLETIEQYAQNNRLEITSHSIATETTDKEGVSVVTMPFSVFGRYESIVQFVELLETIPYHGYIQSLRIQTDLTDPAMKQAEIVLQVSYLEND